MRTIVGVMVSVMLLAPPAAAQVTEPTDKRAEDVAPPAETTAAPAPEPAGKTVPDAPKPEADAAEQETLFGGAGDIDHGGYGAPQLKVGRVAAGSALFVGGKGGWIIDHTLVLGAGGWGMSNRREAPERLQSQVPLADRRFINVGYGGGLIEYIVMPKKVVHGTVGVLIGGGGINLRDMPDDCHAGDRGCMDRDDDEGLSDSFFMLEPEAGLEVNVVKFMRINAGVSYRYVTGVGGIGFENDDLRGLNGTLAVKFGAF